MSATERVLSILTRYHTAFDISEAPAVEMVAGEIADSLYADAEFWRKAKGYANSYSEKLEAENENLREQYNTLMDHYGQKLAEVQALNAQMVEWRGTIRETGYDGAREIVNAYKNLRSVLRFVQNNLRATDTSELAQKVDEARGRADGL